MNVIYKDTFEFHRKKHVVAWINDSFYVNSEEKKLHGQRVFHEGKWTIVSWSLSQESSINNYYENILRTIAPSELTVTNGKSEKTDFFIGEIDYSTKDKEKESLPELFKKVLFLSSIAKEKNLRGMIIGETIFDYRKISHRNGDAKENKQYNIINIEVYSKKSKSQTIGNSYLFSSGSPSVIDEKTLEIAIEDAYRKVFWASISNYPETSLRGLRTLILSPAIVSVIMREVMREINLKQRNEFLVGKQVAQNDFNLKDDPLKLDSPSMRVFDDEAMRTTRKNIIENGIIVELLGTWSLGDKFSRPGNAYGLWYPPHPFHSNLHLSKGDWNEKEIFEETKDGLFIEGVISYDSRDLIITIYPECSWKIKRGELQETVLVREVKLQLFEMLMQIDAIGKKLERRCDWEKDWLICEESPMIRTKGYVI